MLEEVQLVRGTKERRVRRWAPYAFCFGLAAAGIACARTGIPGSATAVASQDLRAASTTASAKSPTITASRPTDTEACPIFPADHIWNVPIAGAPVDANSHAYIESIGESTGLHPDFGAGLWEGGPIGIPYVSVDGATPRSAVTFDYADESDPGPYPIPSDPPIEGGPESDGDRHILLWESEACELFEIYAAYPIGGGWQAGSGAIFDLRGYGLRPEGWTSADAAGLPILPGLVRFEEVAAGEIRHALRFTAPRTRRAYVWPARHFASEEEDGRLPAMGQRFRLRQEFDLDGFSSEVQVILRALQTYGMMLADNGSAWFLSGVPDERWDNDNLHELDRVLGSDLEAVDVSHLQIDPESGQVP